MARLSTLALAGALLLLPAAGFADCPDGARPPSAAEQGYYDRTLAALRDALPAALPDWEKLPPPEGASALTVCRAAPEGDFAVVAMATYIYRPSPAAASRYRAQARELQNEIQRLEGLPPEVQAERKSLRLKAGAATREAAKADSEGHKELAKRKFAEREALRKRSAELAAQHAEKVRAQVAPLKEKLAALDFHPQEFKVTIAANERHPSPVDMSGGVESSLGEVPAAKSPGLKVRGVRIVVLGPAPRRDALAARVDRKKLQALLR